MKKIIFCFFIILMVSAVSCKTTSTASGGGTSTPVASASNFDARTVTREQYNTTMEEVRSFIDGLNNTIRRRDYEGWKASLSPEYFAEISSPENLQRLSELPAMRTRNITLRTSHDYFQHVVVPARANSRVDDIEFVGSNRVKAFTIAIRAGEEQRLLLYDLEKIGNTWKIIN